MISVQLSILASWLAWHKNLNIPVFSDTINVISVKLCTMVLLIDLYLFIPCQWPVAYFEVMALTVLTKYVVRLFD